MISLRSCKILFYSSASILALGALTVLLSAYCLSVSPRFLIFQVLQQVGVANADTPMLLQPGDAHPDYRFDGKLEHRHPRLLLTSLRNWNGLGAAPELASRAALLEVPLPESEYNLCRDNRAAPQLLCWMTNGERTHATRALASMSAAKASGSEATPLWEWALAIDWLALLPNKNPEQWLAASELTREMVAALLRELDDDSASLWHARASTAASCWLLALSIAGSSPADTEILRRSQAHFRQVINALVLTESWPSGYNYWINSRALPVVLALSAYRNGLRDAVATDTIDTLLERIGLWMIHAVRPDNSVQGFADEGPRLDLKDETLRVVDLLAQQTRSAALASFGEYLGELHGSDTYYRDYRWSSLLFHDPTVSPLQNSKTATAGLRRFDGHLPPVALFGAGATNSLYARSDWGPQATFVTAKGGHNFSHHGHYDAGHFTLFKGGPLAVNGSAYGHTSTPHRLDYSIQTIAKNSLLIPGRAEGLTSLFRGQSSPSGGQRLTMPTGSRLRSVEHWQEQLYSGSHYAGANLQAYNLAPDKYVYLRLDLSHAYWTEPETRRVTRDFLYFQDEDLLIIHDVLQNLGGKAKPAWLLHTVHRPKIAGLKRLAGDRAGGVFAASTDRARIEAGKGRFDLRVFLPSTARLTVVGGANYRWAVPNKAGNYLNRDEGWQAMPGFDPAQWRLEVRHSRPSHDGHFLIALLPSLGRERADEVEQQALAHSRKGHVLYTAKRVLVFAEGDDLVLPLPLDGSQQELLVVDSSGAVSATMSDNSGLSIPAQMQNGLIRFKLPGKSGQWQLQLRYAIHDET